MMSTWNKLFLSLLLSACICNENFGMFVDSKNYIGSVCPDFRTVNFKFVQGMYMSADYAFQILKNISKNCCENVSYVKEELKINNSEIIDDLLRRDNDRGNISLYFPIYASRKASFVFDDFPFITWWKSPGPAMIGPVTTTSRVKQVLNAIFKAWPLIVLFLALGGLAGIVFWLAECRTNSNQFPKGFLKGSWEGYWCAMVTMTTVGYGDRAPVTVPGRLFTIFWMLLCLVLTNVFTAHLSSSLTVEEMTMAEGKFMGTRVGISLGTTYYYSEEYNLGARFVEFSNMTEFALAMKNGDVDKGMIEDYLAARYVLEMFPEELAGTYVEKVYSKPLDIGMAVTGYLWDARTSTASGTKTDRFFKCLKKMVQIRMYEENAFVDYPRDSKAVEDKDSFNTQESRDMVVIASGIFAVLCFVGLFCQVIFSTLLKREVKSKTGKNDVEMPLTARTDSYRAQETGALIQEKMNIY